MRNESPKSSGQRPLGKKVARHKTGKKTARRKDSVTHMTISQGGVASFYEPTKRPSGRQVAYGIRSPKLKLFYNKTDGVDAYVDALWKATPMQIVEVERCGVPGVLIKDLASRMEVTSSRFYKILGIPKATAEKKIATKKLVAGSSGQAALGIAKLIGLTQRIVESSTSSDAKGFDAAKWLGNWIERPQPSLGGRTPAELLDTPTGLDVVSRLLGSIESGSYQ